jgi:hypothetical protein
LAKKAAAFFQDLTLFGEDPVLATESAQLLSEHGHRLATALEQLDRLAAELQRIRCRHEH